MAVGVGNELLDLERRTGARVLLIRSLDRAGAAGVTCFAVDTADAWIGRIELREVRESAALDPRARGSFGPHRDPVAVVCTHGRRDPCCAERGRPLERSVAAAFPGVTWESTHVGGDRFAANLVLFPHGLYFGRVEPSEGPGLVRAYLDGRIGSLDRFRGRSSHPFHVQAAEVTVRRELALDGLEEVVVQGARLVGATATVRFSTPAGSRTVALERTRGAPARLTCHSEREEAPTAWIRVDGGSDA